MATKLPVENMPFVGDDCTGTRTSAWTQHRHEEAGSGTALRPGRNNAVPKGELSGTGRCISLATRGRQHHAMPNAPKLLYKTPHN